MDRDSRAPGPGSRGESSPPVTSRNQRIPLFPAGRPARSATAVLCHSLADLATKRAGQNDMQRSILSAITGVTIHHPARSSRPGRGRCPSDATARKKMLINNNLGDESEEKLFARQMHPSSFRYNSRLRSSSGRRSASPLFRVVASSELIDPLHTVDYH